MVEAIYMVDYAIKRKKFSGQTFSFKREISMDTEIYKKNYNHNELTNFFKQSVAVYHDDLESFQSFRFYKIRDKNSGEHLGDKSTNIWDVKWFNNDKSESEQSSNQSVKPSKSIWRKPRFLIPFRILWYMIKKFFQLFWLIAKKDS
jgi:hypothetical protein